MSETSKIRHRVQEYIKGNGLDLGCSVDKIKPDCIGIDNMSIPSLSMNIKGDVSILNWFRDNVFNFVYSSHTLEDIQDTEGTLREWIRVLRKGGYLILYLPHKLFYPTIGHPLANKAHKHDFIPDDIVGILDNLDQTRMVLEEERGCDKYVYENRGNIEYSFLIVAQKVV